MARLYNGVDISEYQGNVDFAAMRDGGIDFVILKASQGSTATYNAPFADPLFSSNMRRFAATSGEIYAGAYHYLMARNVEESLDEARFFVSTIAPYGDDLALWAALDVEDASLPTDRDLLTRIVAKFCKYVETAGFRPMVYASQSWIGERFDVPDGVPVWVADYSITKFPKGARMWQRGTARVPGIEGEVDVDSAFAIMGDVNGDSRVNAKDVTALLGALVGKRRIDKRQADFDRDGELSARDVTLLLEAIAGK